MMSEHDLLTGSEPPITLDDMILCVDREIELRRVERRRSVRYGTNTMTQGKANREYHLMGAVRATLVQTQQVTNFGAAPTEAQQLRDRIAVLEALLDRKNRKPG